jgi:hypothetical protein
MAMTMNERFGRAEDPDLPSDEEIRRLVESRKGTSLASMLEPLQMDVDRDLLERIVRDSFNAIRARPTSTGADLTGNVEPVEVGEQQYIDFLGWLQAQPQLVRIALYPAANDGLDEIEELLELDPTEDEDGKAEGNLPF